MNIEIERVNIANALIKAVVSQEEFTKKLDEIAKKDLKNYRVDGFRKGKAPLKMLKKKFDKELRESTEQSFVSSIYEDGLKQIGITREDVIGDPSFEKLDKDNDALDLEMKVSLKPLFKLDDFSASLPAVDEQTTSAKEVDERVAKIALSQVTPEKSDKEVAEEKDFVQLDFTGYIDDVKFDGGEAKDYVLELGSKSFIGNFEEQLVGMKVGTEKDVNVAFPDNYGNAELAGKDAKFVVSLKEVQVKKAPTVNDELAKKLLGGTADATEAKDITVATLKDEVEKTIIKEKKDAYYQELKSDFFDKLVEQFKDFPLPDNVVEQEVLSITRQKINQMAQEEVDKLHDNKDAVDEIKKNCQTEAQKKVRLTFIIEAIAKAEDVSISEQQLMQEIYMEAIQTGNDPRGLYEQYKSNNLLPGLQMALIEEKVVNKLFDKQAEAKADKKIADKKETKKSTTKAKED